MRLAFITNNASRAPEAVAANLVALGVPAVAEDVVTSAQAAARLLVEAHPSGSPVLVLGGEGLGAAVADVGLVPVRDPDREDVVALVTGYGPDVVWRDVMAAAVRLRNGLPWVASNTDWSLPTHRGPAPGHGVMVRMLSDFSGVDPAVAGKPSPPLLQETIEQTGARRPLMVGDRLDTDIEGARAVGVDSLLVLTGVSDLAVLVSAASHQRPDYVAPDLHGLLAAHHAPVQESGTWRVGGWQADVENGRLQVRGEGVLQDWYAAAAAAGWDHLDRTGIPVDLDALPSPPVVGPDR